MIRRRSMFIFYLLVSYIFIAFTWWVLLLVRINNEAFSEKLDLLKINGRAAGQTTESFEQSQEFKKTEAERKRKVYMIVGEGAVFFVILVVMTYMMHNSLNREVQLIQQQKNFLLSISHELRSPIASSKVAIQTLLRRSELPADKKEVLLNNSLSDMERLHTLVENLLLAAKIEDHNFRIGHDVCDLSEIVVHVVDKIKESAEGLHFRTQLSPEIIVIGDKMGLTSVITNLVENAVKYSEGGSAIDISLTEENKNVVFRIADNGLGIPDEEKKKIFRKFYRVGQEETRKTKGTGLGLYIVEKILRLHNGNVVVRDNAPRGSVFEVILPKVA